MKRQGKLNEKTFTFIDAYNLINMWDEINDSNLENARGKCIEAIIDYKVLSGEEVILVFDAYKIKNKKEKKEIIEGVEVVYTKEFQTADDYIEKEAKKKASSKRFMVKVVTGDYAMQLMTFGNGAMRVSPREFIIDYKKLKKQTKRIIQDEKEINNRNTIGNLIDPEMLEKLKKF